LYFSGAQTDEDHRLVLVVGNGPTLDPSDIRGDDFLGCGHHEHKGAHIVISPMTLLGSIVDSVTQVIRLTGVRPNRLQIGADLHRVMFYPAFSSALEVLPVVPADGAIVGKLHVFGCDLSDGGSCCCQKSGPRRKKSKRPVSNDSLGGWCTPTPRSDGPAVTRIWVSEPVRTRNPYFLRSRIRVEVCA
jgi:hypothetical protein